MPVQSRTLRSTIKQTDRVRVRVVDTQKNAGVHVGRMASKANGAFTIATKKGTVTDIGYRYCTCLQRNDGYGYLIATKE